MEYKFRYITIFIIMHILAWIFSVATDLNPPRLEVMFGVLLLLFMGDIWHWLNVEYKHDRT